jgi:hypothetical protein
LLLNPILTEKELKILFTSLLIKCILLLKDINIAKLIKKQNKSKEKAIPLIRNKKKSNEINIITFIKAF